MEITPRELRDTEIHSEIRGYSRDEVNELLERAANAIDAANQRVTELEDRLTSAQSEAGRTRETEEILHRTLLLAQRAADEALEEATAKSKEMLDEAETSSRRMIEESESEARARGETERRRLEEEIVELAERRGTLLVDVEALTLFEAEHRERMVRALESDLVELQTRPSAAPGARPEPSDVELPEEAGTSEPSPVTPETEAPNDAPNDARDTLAAAPDDADDASMNGRDAASRNEEQAAGADAEENHDGAGSETREVDVSALFEPPPDASHVASGDDIAPSQSSPAPNNVASGFATSELDDPNAFDSDMLDDEAFFAALRDAVHDDAPLGPREEHEDKSGEHQFFDQDAERSSFRDVFRRRR